MINVWCIKGLLQCPTGVGIAGFTMQIRDIACDFLSQKVGVICEGFNTRTLEVDLSAIADHVSVMSNIPLGQPS